MSKDWRHGLQGRMKDVEQKVADLSDGTVSSDHIVATDVTLGQILDAGPGIEIIANDAAVGSDDNGNDIDLTPGQGDGAGDGGEVKVNGVLRCLDNVIAAYDVEVAGEVVVGGNTVRTPAPERLELSGNAGLGLYLVASGGVGELGTGLLDADGGEISLQAGAPNADGDGGDITISAGNAGGAGEGGSVFINPGSSSTGDAGTVAISGARIIMADLPTVDPSQAGALWNDGGTLKVSAGV